MTEVKKEFTGLSLAGVDYSPFNDKRTNFIPLDSAIEPIYKVDAANVIVEIPFGKKKSRVVKVSDTLEVALHYLLGCPVQQPAGSIVNVGTPAECVVTDDTVKKVSNFTYDLKKDVPRFRAVAEGFRSIPVDSIKEDKVKHYVPLFAEMKIAIDVTKDVPSQLKALNFTHVPVQYPSSPDMMKQTNKPTFSPKVALIELLG